MLKKITYTLAIILAIILYFSSIGIFLSITIPFICVFIVAFIAVHKEDKQLTEPKSIPLDAVDFDNGYYGLLLSDKLHIKNINDNSYYRRSYNLKEQIIVDYSKKYKVVVGELDDENYKLEPLVSALTMDEIKDKLIFNGYKLINESEESNNSIVSSSTALNIQKSDIIVSYVNPLDVDFDSSWIKSMNELNNHNKYKLVSIDAIKYKLPNNHDWTSSRLQFNGVDGFGYYPQFTKMVDNRLQFVVRYLYNQELVYHCNSINLIYDNKLKPVQLDDINVYSTEEPIYELVDRNILDVYVEALLDINELQENLQILNNI